MKNVVDALPASTSDIGAIEEHPLANDADTTQCANDPTGGAQANAAVESLELKEIKTTIDCR